MAGYIGSTPVPQGIQEQQSFTATAGQTTFNTLGYSDGNTIKVTLNGVLLEGAGVDYTASNGSDIVLTAAASADDVLTFETLNEFNLVNQNLTTPTFTDTASVTSTTTASVSVSGDTTATVTLKNNTEEDTDGGRESTVIFQGEQSGGEISTLAEIEASHDSSADDEKGSLVFRTNDGSDGSSPTEAMRIDSDQNVGIGISPFANSLGKSLDIVNGVGLFGSGNNSYLSANAHYASAWKYKATDEAAFIGLESASFRFNTAASGTAGTSITFTERARIDADGLKFNGDTAAANALSDYEEGTWTPTTSGTNPTVQNASYTKIGRTVHISIYLNSMSGATGTQINGLPFTPSNLTYSPTRYHSNATNYHQYVLRANSNSTSLTFLDNTDAGVAITTATSSFLVASLTYQTDA